MEPAQIPDNPRARAIVKWARLKRGPFTGADPEEVMLAAYKSFVNCGGEIHSGMRGLLDFRMELGRWDIGAVEALFGGFCLAHREKENGK